MEEYGENVIACVDEEKKPKNYGKKCSDGAQKDLASLSKLVTTKLRAYCERIS